LIRSDVTKTGLAITNVTVTGTEVAVDAVVRFGLPPERLLEGAGGPEDLERVGQSSGGPQEIIRLALARKIKGIPRILRAKNDPGTTVFLSLGFDPAAPGFLIGRFCMRRQGWPAGRKGLTQAGAEQQNF
jgi:hypothetical protein